MMADTTDTTPVTAGIPGALAAVYGEVAAIEARPPVDQGVSDETERSMMQRQGVFRLRSVPCSPSLRMERCWLFLTSFRDDRQGAVAIMVALLSVVLIGFAALAIDGGHLYWTRTQLQGAADASALAGVVVIPTNTGTLGTTEQSTIVGEARTYAQKNMSLANHGNIVATSDVKPGHWDPDTRTFYALSDIPTGEKADAVKVIARRAQVNGNPLGLFFAAVIGFRQTDVTAKAVAYAGPGDGTACILSLNKTEKNAIQITGTNNTDLGKCGIAAWSDDPEGITTTGTADIAVGEVCIAGGIKESGGVSWYPDPPDITEGCDYMPIDPLAYMQPPPVVPVCDAAHTDLIYNTNYAMVMMTPGTYCGGLSFGGNSMTVEFAPGIYVLRGGGLSIAGNSNTYTNMPGGVMFYNTDDGIGNYGNIHITGSSNSITLSAPIPQYDPPMAYPSPDYYAGVLFFGDPASTPGDFWWKLAGSDPVILDGAVYMPTQLVEIVGGSTIDGPCGIQIISDTVKLAGNAMVGPAADDCASGYVNIPLGLEYVLVD